MKVPAATPPAFALGVACLALTATVPAATEPPRAPAPPRPYPAHLAWWGEGRFGIFVHWGPVSLKGTEISWSRANTNPQCPNRGAIPAEVYDNLYREFNPTNFNAQEWIDVAQAAGARYLVLTAKHCDGFLLWHSKTDPYTIAASPFQRDVCAELAAAAHARGFRLGWYFSPMDWRDPDFRTERQPAFVRRMQGELRELLANYGRIDLLWFDWDGHEPLYDPATTYPLVRSLQPGIVINNRLDLGPGNSDRQILSTNANYYTPEQSVGAYDDQRPWESCMTLSARNQWAWGGTNDGVKPFAACLDMLLGCAGGDGNLLLNVGPMPTGEIPPDQAARLRELGTWLGRYGESIYGTRGGPYRPAEYGSSTRRGSTVYLHMREWDGDAVRFPPLPVKIRRARALTGGVATARQTDTALEVAVADADRSLLDTVVALELDGAALEIPAIEVPGPVSLAARARATASNVYQNQAEYAADKAIDGRADTRWATDAGVKSAWLELDLGRSTTFSRIVLKQAYPELDRVRRFALEAWAGGQWKAFHRGERLGAKLNLRFPPVTAERVRLTVSESTDGPTFWEFQLFDR
jgi:alpha-L-fucosidase